MKSPTFTILTLLALTNAAAAQTAIPEPQTRGLLLSQYVASLAQTLKSENIVPGLSQKALADASPGGELLLEVNRELEAALNARFASPPQHSDIH